MDYGKIVQFNTDTESALNDQVVNNVQTEVIGFQQRSIDGRPGEGANDPDPRQKPEVEPEKLPGEDPGVAPEPTPDEGDDDDDDEPYLEPSIGDDPDEIDKKTTIFS